MNPIDRLVVVESSEFEIICHLFVAIDELQRSGAKLIINRNFLLLSQL